MKENEYKLSMLRSFGTEQVSISATIYDTSTDVEEVTKKLTNQFYAVIDECFTKTVERHDNENKLLAAKQAAIDAKVKEMKETERATKEAEKAAKYGKN